ncbi:hypothetical protein AB0L14_24010 [Streptomyces sp. NPDC052727]|uniref:hypothetical protein n=1 Tax=Streptomyces sp. NPDC052727 TaxID=3154854 RepID=UPI00342B7355
MSRAVSRVVAYGSRYRRGYGSGGWRRGRVPGAVPHRVPAGHAGADARAAFVRDVLDFMSGRERSTPYDPLLADA